MHVCNLSIKRKREGLQVQPGLHSEETLILFSKILTSFHLRTQLFHVPPRWATLGSVEVCPAIAHLLPMAVPASRSLWQTPSARSSLVVYQLLSLLPHTSCSWACWVRQVQPPIQCLQPGTEAPSVSQGHAHMCQPGLLLRPGSDVRVVHLHLWCILSQPELTLLPFNALRPQSFICNFQE